MSAVVAVKFSSTTFTSLTAEAISQRAAAMFTVVQECPHKICPQ